MRRWRVGTWAAAVLGAGGLALLGQQVLSGTRDELLVGAALWMIGQAWAYLAPVRDAGADGAFREPPGSDSSGPPSSSSPGLP